MDFKSAPQTQNEYAPNANHNYFNENIELKKTQ